MKNIPYLKIIWHSWKITWHNRYLWWFGFFIALSNLGGIAHYFNSQDQQGHNPANHQKIFHFASQNIHWIIIGLFLLLAIYILLIVLNILGRGALIDSINKQSQKKLANFKSGMVAGRKYFWRIFLLALSLGLFISSIIIVVVAPVLFLFFSHNYIIGSFMAILATLILIPLLALVTYLKIYGYLYIVLGNLKIWPALENSYKLLRENILSSIIMLFLFIPVVSIIWIIIFLMAISPVAVIFFGLGLILFLIAGKIGVIITLLIGLACLFIFMLIFRSVYETFVQSAWVLFFQKIAKPKIEELVKEPQLDSSPVTRAMPIIELENKKTVKGD